MNVNKKLVLMARKLRKSVYFEAFSKVKSHSILFMNLRSWIYPKSQAGSKGQCKHTTVTPCPLLLCLTTYFQSCTTRKNIIQYFFAGSSIFRKTESYINTTSSVQLMVAARIQWFLPQQCIICNQFSVACSEGLSWYKINFKPFNLGNYALKSFEHRQCLYHLTFLPLLNALCPRIFLFHIMILPAYLLL